MSILIKGLEMPTSCMLCPFCVEEADPANGEMCMVTGTLMPPCTRELLDNCPLVPVPEHGRLVDMGEIEERIDSCCDDIDCPKACNECAVQIVMDKVFDAPTIIPAEEVYGQFTDTAGNLHWTGTHSGEHTIKAEEGE